MRPDLTSAEIAMSGSYFDDVLREPRRYGLRTPPTKCAGGALCDEDATPSAPSLSSATRRRVRPNPPGAVLIPSLDGKRARVSPEAEYSPSTPCHRRSLTYLPDSASIYQQYVYRRQATRALRIPGTLEVLVLRSLQAPTITPTKSASAALACGDLSERRTPQQSTVDRRVG